MPSRFELYPFRQGEILVLKKKHPCGGSTWKVMRVGADIGMECQTCGRFQSLSRRKLEKAIRSVGSPESDNSPSIKKGGGS